MSSPRDGGLSTLQKLHLIQESDSAKHLLSYGIRALRTAAFIETTRDPIMTMLSIGLEKTLKLSLGLLHVADSRVWPPRRIFKSDYRHDLIKMEALLRRALRDNIDQATYRALVIQALDAVDSDPAWGPLVAALNRYGKEGRFYYLDAIAESPQREDSPQSFWDAAERVAVENDPQLGDLFHKMLDGDLSLADSFNASINRRLADSLQSFWDLVVTAAVQGVLGDEGKGWGHDFKMVGSQISND